MEMDLLSAGASVAASMRGLRKGKRKQSQASESDSSSPQTATSSSANSAVTKRYV